MKGVASFSLMSAMNFACQMVVVGSHIICVKYILSLIEHSLREIAYVSELGLSSDLVTKSFGPRASG